MDELLRNVQEAIEGSLSVDIAEPKPSGAEQKRAVAGNKSRSAGV
jgi:hypothetical protein